MWEEAEITNLNQNVPLVHLLDWGFYYSLATDTFGRLSNSETDNV